MLEVLGKPLGTTRIGAGVWVTPTLRRDDVEPFGTVLTNLVQRPATDALQAIRFDHGLEAWQMGWQQCALSIRRATTGCPEPVSLRLLGRLVVEVVSLAEGDILVFQPQCQLIDRELFRMLAKGRAVDQLEDMLEPRRASALGQDHRLELLHIVGKLVISSLQANRYDAGIRLGERLEKEMIAVPVGPSRRGGDCSGLSERPSCADGAHQPHRSSLHRLP